MENLKKIEGIDRFLLIAGTLLFGDIPQIVLYFIPFMWPVGWMWGLLAAMVFGFILNTAFDIHIFGPRMGMKAIVYFLMEVVPLIGAISFLSVGMFVITYFHNRHVDAEQGGDAV